MSSRAFPSAASGVSRAVLTSRERTATARSSASMPCLPPCMRTHACSAYSGLDATQPWTAAMPAYILYRRDASLTFFIVPWSSQHVRSHNALQSLTNKRVPPQCTRFQLHGTMVRLMPCCATHDIKNHADKEIVSDEIGSKSCF